MNVCYLPSNAYDIRQIDVIDPPRMEWSAYEQDDPAAPFVPSIRKVQLRESVYDGKLVLAGYDRQSDTLYIRDLSPMQLEIRREALGL